MTLSDLRKKFSDNQIEEARNGKWSPIWQHIRENVPGANDIRVLAGIYIELLTERFQVTADAHERVMAEVKSRAETCEPIHCKECPYGPDCDANFARHLLTVAEGGQG